MRHTCVAASCLFVAAAFAALASDDELRVDLKTDIPRGDFVTYEGRSFDVDARASEDAYVAILALDGRGRVRMVFPNPWQPDNRLRAGETVRVLDISADRPGPVYLEAIASTSSLLRYGYGEHRNPYWNVELWGEFDPESCTLPRRHDGFALSFDVPPAVVRGPSGPVDAADADRQLSAAIERDYDIFTDQVDLFREELRDALPDVPLAFAYADVYVAGARHDVGDDAYHAPTRPRHYASYHDYPDEEFDYERALSGYGTWIYVGGMRVWRPPVLTISWRPFVHGYWTSTRFGWYWVGYEPYAWVVYHYGYWVWDPYYGWCWVPDVWDYRFVPANCWWSFWGDYWWWYPCPPPHHRRPPHMRIVAPDPRHGVVVRKQDFLASDISKVARSPEAVVRELPGGKVEFAESPGPPKGQVELATGRVVRDEPVKSVERPTKGGRGKITIVRPDVPKTPPKAFRDLDQRTRREIQSPPGRRPVPAPRAEPATPPRAPSVPKVAPKAEPARPAPTAPRAEPARPPDRPKETARPPQARPSAPAKEGAAVSPPSRQPRGGNAHGYTRPRGVPGEDEAGAVPSPTPTSTLAVGSNRG